MRTMDLLSIGVLLSALLIVPAYAGQTSAPGEQPVKVKKHKAATHARTNTVKAGDQLNERGKRSDVRNRAAAMRQGLLSPGSAQPSQ